MIFGPFADVQAACRSYAALRNREEAPASFVSSLHPKVSLLSKTCNIQGKSEVVLKLAEWEEWFVGRPAPLTQISVACTRNGCEQGMALCYSFHIHEPERVQSETVLELEDGWIRSIYIYSVRLNSQFPLPEKVVEVAERLRSIGICLALPTESEEELNWSNL